MCVLLLEEKSLPYNQYGYVDNMDSFFLSGNTTTTTIRQYSITGLIFFSKLYSPWPSTSSDYSSSS